jgi:hypothetical protein
VKLDFSRERDGFIEIYDWKTGKTNGDTSVQMGAYAIYAMQKWKKPLDRIRGFVFNLTKPGNPADEEKLTPELIDQTKSFMRESIKGMHGLLSDVSKNVPKPVEFFTFTDNPKLCDSCNFYRMCAKFKS